MLIAAILTAILFFLLFPIGQGRLFLKIVVTAAALQLAWRLLQKARNRKDDVPW